MGEMGKEAEELRELIDFFLLFFTERETRIFKLRDEDMLNWDTIGGITGMSSVACRVMYHRMQDRIQTVRQIAKKFKGYRGKFEELQNWKRLSKKQREEIQGKD